jgi:hypothetical protein
MNDQELTAAVRQSVEGARMDVPEEQITSRGRAIRATRRRRMAAGVTAAATAGAAAIAAAVFVPGSAAPAVFVPGSAAPAVQQAQDTAYVISHVTQALDTVPTSSILFLRHNATGPGSEVTESWDRGANDRTEVFSAGQLISEHGFTSTGTKITSVNISYQNKTWSRSAGHLSTRPASSSERAAAVGTFTCALANDSGIPDNAKMMAGILRTLVSCGTLKADGTATVGGATAIRLTMPGTPASARTTITWYVNPATYLPIHETVTQQGTLLSSLDFQWLPPTAANRARLSLPAAPQGFAQVAMP